MFMFFQEWFKINSRSGKCGLGTMASVHGKAAVGPAVLKARRTHCLTCHPILFRVSIDQWDDSQDPDVKKLGSFCNISMMKDSACFDYENLRQIAANVMCWIHIIALFSQPQHLSCSWHVPPDRLVILIFQQHGRLRHSRQMLAPEALQAIGQALPRQVAEVYVTETKGFLEEWPSVAQLFVMPTVGVPWKSKNHWASRKKSTPWNRLPRVAKQPLCGRQIHCAKSTWPERKKRRDIHNSAGADQMIQGSSHINLDNQPTNSEFRIQIYLK